MKDNFILSDRYSALGIKRPKPETVCLGRCEGTGIIPVKANNKNPVFRRLWQEAEAKKKTTDGYHFIKCPECKGTGKRT